MRAPDTRRCKQDEVDHLLEMLERIVSGDYRNDYVLDKATGSYFPRTFDPAVFANYFAL